MKRKMSIAILSALIACLLCFTACELEDVKVTFDSNGGSAVQEQTLTKGSQLEQPAAPEKVGYTFEGWLLDGNNFVFETTTVESDITLVAKWTPKTDTEYTVVVMIGEEDKTAEYAETLGLNAGTAKYYLTGTTDSSADITEKANAALPEGYHIEASESTLTGTIAGDGSLELKIVYAINTYTVAFTGEGVAIPDQTINHGAMATEPDFALAGYDIAWKYGEEAFDFNTAITEDITIACEKTARTDTEYTVVVMVGEEDKTAEYAEALGLSVGPAKYYLTGTTDSSADITEKANAALPVGYHIAASESTLTGTIAGDGSLELSILYVENTYTIKFNGAGGSGTMDDVVLTYSESREIPTNTFAKRYYTFVKWLCNGTEYTDGQTVSSLTDVDQDVLTFVAVWQEETRVRSEWAVNTTGEGVQKTAGDNGFIYLTKSDFTANVITNSNTFKSAQIDAIKPNDTLTIAISMACWSPGVKEPLLPNWTMNFYAIGDNKNIVLDSVSFGSTRQSYKDPTTTLVVPNQMSYTWAYYVTFDQYETAMIFSGGGLKFKMDKGVMQGKFYAVTVNRSLSTDPVENFENASSFEISKKGASNSDTSFGVENLPWSLGKGAFFESAYDNNIGYLEIRSNVLKAVRAGDSLSFDVWYNGATIDGKDVAIEVYARKGDGKYSQASPIYSVDIRTLNARTTAWKTLSFALTEETASAVQQGSGIAIRLKFNDTVSDLYYKLRVDNLTVVLSDTEQSTIASTAETIEADIAADIAGRFVGFYTKINSITLDAETGKYVANVTIAKDGMYDRTINIEYVIEAQE